jgi:hypothetical protein
MLVVSWRLLKRLMPRRKSMARRVGASTLMARGRAGVDEEALKNSAKLSQCTGDTCAEDGIEASVSRVCLPVGFSSFVN